MQVSGHLGRKRLWAFKSPVVEYLKGYMKQFDVHGEKHPILPSCLLPQSLT